MTTNSKTMKLYECKRNSWVVPVTDTTAPPGAREVLIGETVKFHHLDGMYSFCQDKQGNPCHLPAWQEVRYATDKELGVSTP